MKHFTKFIFAMGAVFLPLVVCGQAKEVAKPMKKEAKTDFIRVSEGGNEVKLQTSVTRYVRDGLKVDLIGAVHVADKQYFTDLNVLFEKYDALLFEMVGGDKMEGGKKVDDGKKVDVQFSFLDTMYNSMQKRLALAGQKEHVDYGKENFVHADLTMEEFTRLQSEKKESLFSFALKNAQSAPKGVKQPSMLKMMRALWSGNSDMLKLSLVHTLGAGDDQIAAFAGKSVIIGDRNVKCLEVMEGQVKAGKKNIGIFYGAAHFPDMEERILAQGFKKKHQFWMTAWNIDKKKANK